MIKINLILSRVAQFFRGYQSVILKDNISSKGKVMLDLYNTKIKRRKKIRLADNVNWADQILKFFFLEGCAFKHISIILAYSNCLLSRWAEEGLISRQVNYVNINITEVSVISKLQSVSSYNFNKNYIYG